MLVEKSVLQAVFEKANPQKDVTKTKNGEYVSWVTNDNYHKWLDVFHNQIIEHNKNMESLTFT